MESTSAYGAITSPSDAEATSWTPTEEPVRAFSGEAAALWEYHTLGKVMGIPVRECDRELKVDRPDMLQEAFLVRRLPRARVFRISPDGGEPLSQYEEILAKVASGECELVDEDRQFDAQSGAFVVWLRWNELSVELNQRYEYLREE